MPTVVVPVTETLPADTVPDTEALPPVMLPVADTVNDVMPVAAKVPVATDVRPVMVGDRVRVTSPLGAEADRLVPVVMPVTPEFTMVMVPEATVFDSPLPVATLAVVNDDASVNTLVKLSSILLNAVSRLSLPVGLLGAPMLMMS